MIDELLKGTVAGRFLGQGDNLLAQTLGGQALGMGGGDNAGLMGLMGMSQQQQQPVPPQQMPVGVADQLQGQSGVDARQAIGMAPEAEPEGLSREQRLQNYERYQAAMSAAEAARNNDFSGLVRALIMNS